MNSRLTLEYEFSRDGDDFGWLATRVETPDFIGRNGMWVQWQDLVGFADTLGRYPLEADHHIAEEWGVGEGGEYVAVTRLAIGPKGRTGGLLCNVELANYFDTWNRCRTHFLTDYPSLARFREQIAALMRKEAPQAVLDGEKSNYE